MMFNYTKVSVYAICYASVVIMLLSCFNQLDRENIKRKMWTYLGNGDCEWTGSAPFADDADPYGTLFVGYPASGMRVTWQHTEAITGTQLRDDFFALEFPKIGLVKTQYPHYEGIWSYGSDLDQTILLIRNPRWAIPSYHTLINEIGYAHSWEVAYEELENVFTRRAPMEDWIRWRDYRINDEIILWGYYIDFYMSDGDKYWMDYDFERNGMLPFRLLNDTDRPWEKDYHCIHDIDCYPKVVISYERLRDANDGPIELTKIASALRGKEGIDVIPEDGIECLWHETWIHTPEPSNDNRDNNGLPREAYTFTIQQLTMIKDKLEEMKIKYSTGSWTNNNNAIALVENFDSYLINVQGELNDLNANPPPTPAPDAGYLLELKKWYNSKGKGNRYDKSKLEGTGIWDMISGFYPDDS